MKKIILLISCISILGVWASQGPTEALRQSSKDYYSTVNKGWIYATLLDSFKNNNPNDFLEAVLFMFLAQNREYIDTASSKVVRSYNWLISILPKAALVDPEFYNAIIRQQNTEPEACLPVPSSGPRTTINKDLIYATLSESFKNNKPNDFLEAVLFVFLAQNREYVDTISSEIIKSFKWLTNVLPKAGLLDPELYNAIKKQQEQEAEACLIPSLRTSSSSSC